ncbi:hypothetical protein FIBSPDRAFT_926837 [Athelia psychrophila]|uniref:Uncharacterized protein n=1 Tax=Athelia psychrophila TaxID=1759441 RepID=A0A166SNF4_9AGAM|nr:hypothetical protein FIBSPDRAFT_926837 [Fibularhizoctonia sp. CBS 109695]
MDSAISQPPTKLPRTDSNDDESPPLAECTRPTPWFEDGYIMFETERGHIGSQFCYLRDIFVIGQAQEGEIVDGYPVVHLVDKPQNLEHVAEALHNSRKALNIMMAARLCAK